MSNLGLLEVFVKSIESECGAETEYDTAVDLVHFRWTDTTYLLQIDIYDGLLIEINTCDMVTSYSELWPEENYSHHPSDREPKKSRRVRAEVYSNAYHYESLSEDVAQAMIQAVDARVSDTLMVPFPRDLMEQLFDRAFNIYLAKRINAWKQAA